MTSKERATLMSMAQKMDPIFQIGKNSISPELVEALSDALEARELIKIAVLKNCGDDPKELAQIVSERTRSQVVQVIGKRIVLYRESKNEKKHILK
ncbi:MAG: ribosome assembly RNA-binding protein YhbY [Clostridiales bacterium]|nr:ribosome assembly RNA-binding protein YhbY [Clostridiales bacterium]